MICSLLILKVDFKLLDFELWLYAKIKTNLRSQKIYLRFREELFCLLCAPKCLQSVCASSWLRGSLSTSPSEARPLPPQGTQPIFLGSQLHRANIFSHEDTSTNPSVSLSVKKATEKNSRFWHIFSNFGTPISTSITSKNYLLFESKPPKIITFFVEFEHNVFREPSPISHLQRIYVLQ